MRQKSNRANQILELLAGEQKIEVTELSTRLGVSQVTIRKDLDDLEQKGIIQREHGYALLRNSDDLRARIAYHYEAKMQIAKRACQLVHDSDTIMIESGSCCALLSEALAATHKDLTIITNSAFIASYIRGKSNFRIILLGGIYQQDSQVMVGPMVLQGAENFWVDLFFIGVDGWSIRAGFTNQDQMRAQAVRDMSRQAQQVVVLTESEKFSRHGTVPLNLKNGIDLVITDAKLNPQAADGLRSHGVEIITV